MVVDEGDLFLSFNWHLRKIYPGVYAPATDYPVVPTGRAPMRGESQRGKEGGKVLGTLTNNSFTNLGTAYLGWFSNLGTSVAMMNNLIHNVTTFNINSPLVLQMPELR